MCTADGSINKNNRTYPGPGNYDANYRAEVKKEPNWVMGTAKRSDMINPNTRSFPGAGTYEMTTKIGAEAPKYHLGARLQIGGSMDQAKVKVPGPGTYSPNKRIYDPAI